MAKRKLPSPTTGEMVETTVIEINDVKNDKAATIHLADGTVLRLRVDIVEVSRFEGEWDPDGNPLYNIRSGNILAVLDSPDDLKKHD